MLTCAEDFQRLRAQISECERVAQLREQSSILTRATPGVTTTIPDDSHRAEVPMDALEQVELRAPPEIVAALRHGKWSRGWVKSYCPVCDPDGRKRGKHTLRAGILTDGPRKGQAWWGCMRCHCEKDFAATRRTEALRWEVDRAKMSADAARIKAYALEMVEAATFVRDGDPVDRYLRETRKLRPLGACWPTDLRVASRRHNRHPHTKQPGPVMVAAVRDVGGTIIACHRTYLHELADGRVVKVSDTDRHRRPIVPAPFCHRQSKLSLSGVHGAAIRLGIDSEEIAIAEGIESALGLAMAAQIPSWSTLSSGNMPNLVLPMHVRRVVIGPDVGDEKEAGMKCATEFRRRVIEEGKRRKKIIEVEIRIPAGRATDWAEWAEYQAQ